MEAAAETEINDAAPRNRRPLAPAVLAPILERRIAEVLPSYQGDLVLADLDADRSENFSPQERRVLGAAVRSESNARWHKLAGLRPFPNGLSDSVLLTLELEPRARNALLRMRWKSHISCPTIGELMRTPQFGIGSLLDVLTALDYDSRLAAVHDRGSSEASICFESVGKGYPSHGKPLAPWVLAPILRREFPDDSELKTKVEVLAELDVEHSELLSEHCFQRCGERILRVTALNYHTLASVRPLSRLPEPIDLGALPLATRTHNLLSRFPVAQLRECSIDDLMRLPNFGVVSLLDLLATVEMVPNAPNAPAEIPVLLRPEACKSAPRETADSEAGATELDGERIHVRHEPLATGEPKAVVDAGLPPRVQAMKEMYDAGATLEEIGAKFDRISRERVRQLLKQHGIDPRPRAERRRSSDLEKLNTNLPKIRQLVEEGLHADMIASRLGLNRSLVQAAIDADPLLHGWMNAFRRKKQHRPLYSDDELLDCLRTASLELGGVLSTAAYDRFIRGHKLLDGRSWPTHQTPSKRFGSWRAALEKAGLRANPPSPVAGQRIFDRPRCIDAVLEVQRSLGRLPTVQEYEEYAALRSGALPSIATIRNRCGSWQDTLRMAADFARGRY